jgi:hypothetical protein
MLHFRVGVWGHDCVDELSENLWGLRIKNTSCRISVAISWTKLRTICIRLIEYVPRRDIVHDLVMIESFVVQPYPDLILGV